jgi:hypothetical protein
LSRQRGTGRGRTFNGNIWHIRYVVYFLSVEKISTIACISETSEVDRISRYSGFIRIEVTEMLFTGKYGQLTHNLLCIK